MAEANGNGNGDIRFTVKEMLAGLDKKLDDIDKKLDTKADVKAFEALEYRVRDIELRGSPHLQTVQGKVEDNSRRLQDIEQGKNLSPYAAGLISEFADVKRKVDDITDYSDVKRKVDQFWKLIVIAGGIGGAIGYGASILSRFVH